MLEQDPCLWEVWPSPTCPTVPSPLTKHLSCLMCPIELHTVRLDAVISGTDVMFAEAPGWSLGAGKVRQAWAGQVPTDQSLQMTGRYCQKHTRQFSLCGRRLGMAAGGLRDFLMRNIVRLFLGFETVPCC